MIQLLNTISGVSVFLPGIIGFLVVYANQFLIGSREKRIWLLGGSQEKRLVMTVAVCWFSRLGGWTCCRPTISQFMMFATATCSAQLLIRSNLCFHKLLIQQIYFVVMFVVALIFNVTVSRYKLIDLLLA